MLFLGSVDAWTQGGEPPFGPRRPARERDSHWPVPLSFCETQLSNPCGKCRNVDLPSIGYAFRPRLRCRLTPGGRTCPGKPWDSGDRNSHPVFRYSCPHNRQYEVHGRFRAPLRPVVLRSPTIGLAAGPRIRRDVYSRSFSARGLSSSQLLRTVQMMAASKPTSYLSERPHCLSDLTWIWGLIRRSWAVSLSTMKLSPHCLTAGYAIDAVFGV